MADKNVGVLAFLLSQNSFPINTVGFVLSLLSTYVLARYVYLLVLHPLADVPGPRLCSISRLPYWLATIQGRDVQWLYRLHDKYGPVVRFGPTDLSYVTAQAWKDIHGYGKGRPENGKAPEFSVQPANGMILLPSFLLQYSLQ